MEKPGCFEPVSQICAEGTHRKKLRALPVNTLPSQGTGTGGQNPCQSLGGSGDLLCSASWQKNTPVPSRGQMDSTGCGKETFCSQIRRWGRAPLQGVPGQREWDRRAAKGKQVSGQRVADWSLDFGHLATAGIHQGQNLYFHPLSSQEREPA